MPSTSSTTPTTVGSPEGQPRTRHPAGNGLDLGQERLPAAELTRWLEARVPELTELWVKEIRVRGMGTGSFLSGTMERFASELVRLLPLMLGPHRAQVQPLWDQASELFGVLAAKRGLAAGEAIEEMHVLRELVIRDLYRDPPLGGAVPLSLREVLRLNRSLDRAVTHASVGHTDALFFEFFEAQGGPPVLEAEDIAAETERQLGAIREEVDELLARASRVSAGSRNTSNER